MPEDNFKIQQFNPSLESPITTHNAVTLDEIITPRPRVLRVNIGGVLLIEDENNHIEEYVVRDGETIPFRARRVMSTANVGGTEMSTTAQGIKAWE